MRLNAGTPPWRAGGHDRGQDDSGDREVSEVEGRSQLASLKRVMIAYSALERIDPSELR
jgi:hypothetical protein